MLKKPLNIFLLLIALIIVAIYISGYNYLFRGLRLTYLRGEKSSTIDDGQFFSSKTISRGNPKPWPTDVNYNKKKLSAALENRLKETESVSFLVIQNGNVLQEHYWDHYDRKTASNSFSMAKTVSVLLLGKAIDDGKVMGLNQNFSDFYPDFSEDQFGKKLTLENLAAMEAGLDWSEDYQNPFLQNAAAYYGSSLASVVFNLKFKENPGEKFEYQSGATQLLGYAVSRAVGMPVSMYASIKLWKPLGMEQNAEWSTDELGMEKTFCCIQSNARDFAKLGYLLLNKGKIDNTPFISEGFVDRMITPTRLSNGVYGLGVWINNDYKIPHYYLRGLYGQYVIVVPEKNMIIVRLGKKESGEIDNKNRPKDVEFYIKETLALLD